MTLTLMLSLYPGMLFFMNLFSLLCLLPIAPLPSIPCPCLVPHLFPPCIMRPFSLHLPILPFLLIPSLKFIITLIMTYLMMSQKLPLMPLLILFPLESLLDPLKDHHIYRSSTAIMSLLSSLCLLPSQVHLIPFLLMCHIITFLPPIRSSVVPFLPLLNLNFTIKLSLIPNGKLPWLLR